MTALTLITQFQADNTGMSIFIDNKLVEIQEALRIAGWRKEEDSLDWYSVNLRIAWKLAEELLQYVPYGAPRQALESIYLAIAAEVK
jgi:hypothetical protein